MSRRRILSVLALACALLIGTGVAAYTGDQDRSAAEGASTDALRPTGSMLLNSPARRPGAPSGLRTGTTSLTTPPSPTGSSAPGSAGAMPGSVPGVELPPEAPAARQGLRIPARAPLLRLPLPRDAMANGRLVEGFPTVALGPAPGSRIDTSSLTSQGRWVQVALTARHPSADRVLLHYRRALGRYGFREVRTPASGSSRAVGFVLGRDSLVFTVSETSGGAAYTLFATLRAPASPRD